MRTRAHVQGKCPRINTSPPKLPFTSDWWVLVYKYPNSLPLSGITWVACSTLASSFPGRIKLITHSNNLLANTHCFGCWPFPVSLLYPLKWLSTTLPLIDSSWDHLRNKLLILKSLPRGLLLGDPKLRLHSKEFLWKYFPLFSWFRIWLLIWLFKWLILG